MKVTFVYTDIGITNSRKFNQGIAQLSSCLKLAGHKVSLLHFFEEIGEKDYLELIRRHSPDLVAFSSISNLFPEIKKFASWTKKNFALPTIYGGAHPTIAPEESIASGLFDFICRGEGEAAIVELCDRLEKKEDISTIQNLWVKKNSQIYKNPLRPLIENLDSLSSLDYELFNYETLADATHFKRLVIMANRGCPYNCTYCCNHAFRELYPNKQKYVRFRSADKVISEIEYGLNKYPFLKEVRFFDDTLTLNKQWFREFAEKYKKKIKLPYSINDRVNHINEEVARLLKDSGCYFVEFGIENGSERIRQEIMKRGISEKQITAAFSLCRKYGIRTSAFNIIGVPEECLDTVLDTIKLNARAAPNWSHIFYFHPYIGTELYAVAKNKMLLSNRTFKTIFEGPTLKLRTISEEQIVFAYTYFRGLVKLYRAYFSFPKAIKTIFVNCTDYFLKFKFFPYAFFSKLYQPLYRIYSLIVKVVKIVFNLLEFHHSKFNSDKMYFISGYLFPPKTYGGGDLVHRKIYEYLQRQRMETEIICLPELIEKLTSREYESLKSVKLLKKFYLMFKIFWQLRDKKGILFEDVYFARELFFYNIYQKFLLGSRIITYVHHFDYYRSSAPRSFLKMWVKFKEYLLVSFANKIVVNSEFTRQEIISLGIKKNKIEIAPPGVDRCELMDFPKTKSPMLNLLFVGHCRPRKGIHFLLESIGKLNYPNIKLDLVGRRESPEYYLYLLDLVKKFNLSDRVVFHGRIDHNQLCRLYSQADIFIFPSLWEGFGIVLLEAMYYKLPIIASNISAIPELVIDGENGLLVPPADVERLAKAIDQLIENSALRKEMGERGYQKVINFYSWENTGEKFYRIVKDLINGKNFRVSAERNKGLL